MSVKINCQVPDCTYVAENDSEGIAIALLTSHNSTHLQLQAMAMPRRSYLKAPQISRPELKQDIPAEEWYTFLEEWKRFKKIIEIPQDELADQLFQCCDRPLGWLLLRENPEIVEEGETQLLAAMKRMAVLQVATSVRRARLRAMTQEHGQLFREYFANVRAVANTCEYLVKCPHPCCANLAPVDYTTNVVKEVLIAGIADVDIHKEVLGHSELDIKSDKDIVKLVEEKEIAKNACGISRSSVSALSSYRKQAKDHATEQSDISKKLTMKGKCTGCHQEMNLLRYRSES